MKRGLAAIFHSKPFWICLMFCAAGLYLAGFCLLLFPCTRLTGVCILIGIVVLHLVELKTTMRIGRERKIPMSRIVFMGMIFGFTWWLPLKSGII
jgi:hypothetical protein